MPLRLHDSSNTSRRTIHPWWQAVSDSAGCFGPSCDISRSVSDADKAPVEWYVSHKAGCLATYAARQSLEGLGDALADIWEQLAAYWNGRDWATAYLKRRIKLGLIDDGKVSDAPF